MLLGMSLMWIASFTFLVYQWLSLLGKLYFFPQWLVSDFLCVFWDGGILGSHESYISVMFFYPLLHGSSHFPNVYFSAFAWHLVDYTILLVWVSGIFRSDQEPITRSVILRYILPSAQSQKCLFLDPDFQRKAVTMMTATKAKNMAEKLLARSVFRTSAV